jgi:ATP-dependent Clp protease ATP-binding subunit ClpC
MGLHNEPSLQQVLDDASAAAERAGRPNSSAHLLLALLGTPNPARRFLVDRGLQSAAVANRLTTLSVDETDLLQDICERSQRIAQSCGARAVTALHLLIVLSSLRNCVAHQIMFALGLEPGSLRAIALALATGGARKVPATALAGETSATEKTRNRSGARGDRDQDFPALTTDDEPRAVLDPGNASPSKRERQRRSALRDPRVTRGRADQAGEAIGGAEVVLVPPNFDLDPEEYPTLTALGRNLSQAAVRKELEPLVGRRELVGQILDILGKRRANNPCLVGEPGVGKTAIVHGLAYLQVYESKAIPLLAGRTLIELNMGSLLSGTQLRGAFSERLAALRTEVAQADGRIVIFLDEIHTIVGAGSVGEGAYDAVSDLSAAMAQGQFPCIGATSTENFRKYIEEAPAFRRRLQPLLVAEPTVAEATEVLRGVMPVYATHHQVRYSDSAFDGAVRLSSRYLTDRYLPDKAISLLDLAGSRARRQEKQEVDLDQVARLVSETTQIPVDRLLMTDTQRFLEMEAFMRKRIVGHGEIAQRIAQVVRRNYAGFASDRPIGSFLFLGPTGVGKTEMVKALADFLFQSDKALCRFDMSEFMEPHSVARLIGSPPGYVGHDAGGQLTEAIRKRPYQIVLLDEVEKAHGDVLQLLLQLLDEGRLTDGRGRTVDFSNTVVVMTSNLGAEHYSRRRAPIGFGGDVARPLLEQSNDDWPRIQRDVLDAAKRAFPIELWNRIEERLVFEPLSRHQVIDVARLLLSASSARLAAEKGITFVAEDDALTYLVGHGGGYDVQLGARPMRTVIQRLIEVPIAELILRAEARSGDRVRVSCDGTQLVFDTIAQA